MDKIMENELVCKCKKVKYSDIENALHDSETIGEVEDKFRHVQEITHCSTGCGGCHDKIMDIIANLIYS